MTQTEVLKIGGMHCGKCVERVKRALNDQGGVTVQEVTIGEAVVVRDTDVIDQPLMREVIEGIGFKLLTVEPGE